MASFCVFLFLTILCISTTIRCDNLVTTTANDLPEYDCTQAGSRCSLFNVELTRTEYRYKIIADDPRFVQDVTFELSSIPYFTAIDLCTQLPYLFEIRAENVSMEEMDSAAFEYCDYLTTLELNDNKLKTIPSTVFTRPNPQFVQLANNQLSRIDKTTFASLQLELLNLAGNNFNTFPIDAFRAANFKWLFLQSNGLIDLDVDQLTAEHPRLSEGILLYGDNDIACSRIEEINSALRRIEITYQPIEGFHFYYPKKRYYEQDSVEGLPCIPDRAYTAMFYRKLFLNLGTLVQRKTIL